jgi:hypothetical protein
MKAQGLRVQVSVICLQVGYGGGAQRAYSAMCTWTYSRHVCWLLRSWASLTPPALPTIREMLDDPTLSDVAGELVKALVAAGGEEVARELNNRLEQDLAFWRSMGPLLQQNWWNQDPRPDAPLRGRYLQTYQLIIALEQTHYPAARATAVELRDFWRSLPLG